MGRAVKVAAAGDGDITRITLEQLESSSFGPGTAERYVAHLDVGAGWVGFTVSAAPHALRHQGGATVNRWAVSAPG